MDSTKLKYRSVEQQTPIGIPKTYLSSPKVESRATQTSHLLASGNKPLHNTPSPTVNDKPVGMAALALKWCFSKD